MKNIIDNLKVLTYIRREHLSSEVMNPHSHNSWEILYCTKGTIEIKSYLKNNPSSNIIHVGQYAIIEPNIKHHLAFKEDSYLMVLEIEEIDRLLTNQLLKSEQTKRELPSIYKAYSKLNNVLVLNDTNNIGKDIDDLISCFVNMTTHHTDNLSLAKYEHSITLEKILFNICRACNKIIDKKSNIYINKCIYYINSHYTEDIKVADIAKDLNISSSYLERIFKTEYNQSIIEYIINQRLNHAIILLKQTSLSYKTIAERSGFKSYIQLYKAFKAKLNCTIDEFKQNRDYVQFFHEDFHNN